MLYVDKRVASNHALFRTGSLLQDHGWRDVNARLSGLDRWDCARERKKKGIVLLLKVYTMTVERMHAVEGQQRCWDEGLR